MAKSPASSKNAAGDAGPTPPAFEQSLDELETLVARMEQGEMGLDESLAAFERGVALYRTCQNALDQAELRVRKLLDPEAPDGGEPFEPESR